jgi:coenzyme F420-dependent oxidoreductase
MKANSVAVASQEPSDLFDCGTLAEEVGLDAVWFGEAWGESAVPRLTQLLERTETIDVCSGIFNIYTRTPGLIAMTANTLADIGDGRFRIGLGASGPAVIENFHGVEFEHPLRRTREYVEIIRAYLAGERVEYDGELFELAGFELDVDTYHECPMYVASLGETNRQLTGEFADGWMPLLVPSTDMEDALEAVERGADRADRSLEDVDVAPWIPTCISESDPQTAKAHVRGTIGFYVGGMGDFYANAISDFGFGEEADAIRKGWQEEGPRGATGAVTDEMVSAFGAAGTPAEAAESFDRFASAGADSPVAYLPAEQASGELIEETITHL